MQAQETSEVRDMVKMNTAMRSLSFHLLFHEPVSVNVDWGDGTSQEYSFEENEWTQVSHFYNSGNVHRVIITGDSKILKGLNLHGTYVDYLDISGSENLNYLRVSYTYLSALDLTHNYEIRHLYAGDCEVEKISIWNNPKLELVVLYNTPLENNSSELINLIKSLPTPFDFTSAIYLYNEESVSWIEPICQEKKWIIHKSHYK